MQTESAQGAYGNGSNRSLNGLRRLSLAMLATEHTAERFSGLSRAGEGDLKPGQLLAAFKAAAPYLGVASRFVHAIDWLFGFTQPQDWQAGNRPVVWPSALMQREALGLGLTQAKAINRHLIELGLVVMKDSPNGKRYGRRNSQGRLMEAYGFDLSPIAARHAEFVALAAKGRAERERMRRLRRRSSIAKNGLLQILDTVHELGLADPSWAQMEDEARKLARSLARVERLDEMELGVNLLERRQREARDQLESLITAAPASPTEIARGVDTDPKRPENRPHILTTNECLNLKDTVVASGKSKPEENQTVAPAGTAQSSQSSRREKAGRPVRSNTGTTIRLSTDELLRFAPRLKPYLQTSSPGWPEIIDAADWLRHDLGVSKTLWGDACLTMGREEAAIALAIVSAKPPEHFRSNPGGYFYGMVTKAKAGELNLARTVWGLRGRISGAQRHETDGCLPVLGRVDG
jgi:replication initiation protein RepC